MSLTASRPPLEPVCLSQLLACGLQLKADELALVSTEGRWTWRDLDCASENYAANLLALGIKQGDRVASLMPNGGATMIHYLACLKSGIVATPLNYRYTAQEIDRALAVSGASALLVHAERDAEIADSKMVPILPIGVLSYGGKDDHRPSFETLLESPPPHGNLPTPAPDDPAFILFTSGSTGSAKAVTHTFATLGWIVASVGQSCGMTANDVVLLTSSLAHIGALMDTFMALAAGARVVNPRSFGGRELLYQVREHRPTVVAMLPAMAFGLTRDPDAKREDFASLRLFLVAGDKVPSELEREFSSLTGLSINEHYAMSETGVATIQPLGEPNKVGSVGRPAMTYRLSIRDESGNEVPAGTVGRLWIKSPCTTVGYWNDVDSTSAVFNDGWFDTDDVMKQDEYGYLWFCGRRKQIIIHDGSNVTPQEVEDALIAHPAVASAGVVGVPNLVHGENVYAFVTFKVGAVQCTPAEVIDFARLRVGYKAPEDVFVLDQMPLNPSGKVDRATLREMALARLAGEEPD
ncbi:class I adenylate-forming enzyme family protein [Mesorhizobium sp.]|uniref:class I adenylate-forming enzyme family protein n=1 Tax=Mesorhizobium sp. TaxID=1871066 RepID=UPI00257D6266|nr:class I adenylate-forming enzyme family protein [Mesorhizobium sp.]